MVKKLIIDHNEKGEIVSPSYVDIVSKINEIIELWQVCMETGFRIGIIFPPMVNQFP